MADVATLGVNVTLTGAEAAATGLNTLAASADKAEQSTRRLIGTDDGLTVAQRSLMEQGVSLERVLSALGVSTQTAATETASLTNLYNDQRSIVLAHMQALEMDAAATETATVATTAHGLSLGRVNMELGTATGRILGMNTAMTRFGAMLGGSVAGYGPMIAITAAIVAAGEAWKHYTEEARKAQEQQDKNTKALRAWYEEVANGGKRAQEVADAQKDLADKQKQLAGLESQAGTADFSSTRNLQRANDLRKQIADVRASIAEDQRMIAAGGADVDKTLNEQFDEQQQRHSQALAELVKFDATNQAIRKQANEQLQQDLALENQYQKAGLTERAALYAQMAKSLQDAIDPKTHIATGGSTASKNDTITALGKQLAEMRKVNEEENIANVQREYEIKLVGMVGYAKDVLLAQEKAALETLKARHDLVGVALNEALAMIKADEDAAIAKAKLVRQLQEEADARKMLLDIQKQVAEIGRRNEEKGKQEINDAADAIKAAQDYHDQLEKIARLSLERILTHGMKSWQDFFGDLLKGFEAMMTAMEREAAKHHTTPGGAGYEALRYGSIAISSTLAGYDIAKQTGNRAESVLGGAASGAELGGSIAGPPGAFIGAMAGTIGALVGLHKSASQVADDMRRMQLGQDEVALSLTQWRAQITGSAADQKAAAQLGLKVQYEQLRMAIETTEAGKKQEEQRNKDLKEADQLYTDAQKKLTDSTLGLTDAMLNAVQGYKYQATIFGAAPSMAGPPAPVPVPAATGNSGYTGGSTSPTDGGTMTVNVMLPDGSVLATTVVKDLQRRAGSKFRDSTKWSQIQ